MKRNKRRVLLVILMLILIAVISVVCILTKKSVLVSQVNGLTTKNLNAANQVYKITLSKKGGENGANYLYVSNKKVYRDSNCTDELTDSLTIEIPSKKGCKFVGYFIGEDKVISSAGKIINANLSKLTGITADTTIVAKYHPVYSVNFNLRGGVNGTTKIYMSYVSDIENKLTMYSDELCTKEIENQKITVPNQEGYKFLGYKINNGVSAQDYSFDSEGKLVDKATRNVI